MSLLLLFAGTGDGTPPVPVVPLYTLVVPFQRRVFTVPFQSRTFVVAFQRRTFVVPRVG